MKRVLQKFSKGSILAYTLILLFIVLVASIGMMSASITNLRSVSTNDQSTNAFQIADSGSQAVVAKIKKVAETGTGKQIRDISGVSCSTLAVLKSGSFLEGSYKVTFLDKDEKALGCNDSLSSVTSIKSVGTYASTARAIEVAVAAGGCDADNKGGVVTVDENSNSGQPDWNAIDDFMQNHGPIVGYKCALAGNSGVREVLFGGEYDVLTSGAFPYGNYGDPKNASFQCTSGGCNYVSPVTLGSYPCSSGWRIYGLCSK